jgi:amino acid adenylation domain-containing protein
MLVHELLARSARRVPDAPAVIEPGRSITYGELARRSGGVAVALAEAGVRPGDRVILAVPNSIEFVAAYFGVLQAGAVVVPLPPGPRSDRLPKVVQDCEPSASIVDDTTWPVLAASAPHVSARFIVARGAAPSVPSGAAVLADLDSRVPPATVAADGASAVDENELAAIIYTSGSTGTPRGVMLTHRNIAANTDSIVQYLGLTSADKVMVVLPFYYVYGLSLLHTHIAVGGTLVLDNRFAFPNVVVKAMREHAVTGFAGVPSTFALLLHRSNLASTALPALRYVTQAGGAMPPARIHEWLRVLPRVPFFVMYGATEASARLTYLPPGEVAKRPGSIGRAIPNVEVRVLRDDGQPAPTGEVGELVARGPNISSGYWRRPDDTRERFGPDGYRTGDLGYMDEDGFFFIVGRRNEMLKIGAHRVSPREIEDVLHEHPAVYEAAVVGTPDEILGEAAVAYVVLRDECQATDRDLILFARARVPEHKVPVRVAIVAEIPKTPAGKPDKRALQEAPCVTTS